LIFIYLSVAVIIDKITNFFFWIPVNTFHQHPILAKADSGATFVLTEDWVFIDTVITIVVDAITDFWVTRSTRTMDNHPLIT
jgi:hypothetical protein